MSLDEIYDLLLLQVSFPDLKLLSLRDYELVGEMTFFLLQHCQI